MPYPFVSILFVSATSVAARLGEITGYFQILAEQALLAVTGAVMLGFDPWILAAGRRLAVAGRRPRLEAAA